MSLIWNDDIIIGSKENFSTDYFDFETDLIYSLGLILKKEKCMILKNAGNFCE